MTIEVKNLTKKYGQQLAVDDLSFTSAGGEIIGFLGPNGAGKTTTFKMLTAYLSPSQGSIIVNGYDVSEQPEMVRKSIGYLSESNPLYEDMYVKEFLMFIARIHDIEIKNNEMDVLLAKVGLEKESHKKIEQLSKGYRQRVGLAQAIVHDPPIIILDEPTTGLDVNQITGIRGLIKELGKNKTILFSSHIMQEIEAICDRVIILDKGVKIVDNDLETVRSYKTGVEEVTVELTAPTKDLTTYKKIPKIKDVLTKDQRELTMLSDAGEDIRAEIFNAAVSNGDIIIEMKKKDKSIEQVFQQLTSKQ